MTDANDAVIVAAVRTAIGRAGRGLAGLSIQDIGISPTEIIGAGKPGSPWVTSAKSQDFLRNRVIHACEPKFGHSDPGAPRGRDSVNGLVNGQGCRS